MANEELVAGIRQHIANGDSKEVIKKHVIDAGYSQQEFFVAYGQATQGVEAPQMKTPLDPPDQMRSVPPDSMTQLNLQSTGANATEAFLASQESQPQTVTQASSVAAVTLPKSRDSNINLILKIVLIGLLEVILLFFLASFITGFRQGLEEARQAGLDEATKQAVSNAKLMAVIYLEDNDSYAGFCNSQEWIDYQSKYTSAAALSCDNSESGLVVEGGLTNGHYYCTDGEFAGQVSTSSQGSGRCLVENVVAAGNCAIDTPEVKEIKAEITALDTQMAELMESPDESLDYSFEEWEVLSAEYSEKVLQLYQISISADFDQELQDVYAQYCSPNSVIKTDAEISASPVTLVKMQSLLPEEISCELKSGLVTDEEIPEALARLGQLSGATGHIDESIDLTACAAERYYSPTAMLTLSRMYSVGTEEFFSGAEQIKTPQKNFDADNQEAYYWIVSHLVIANLLGSPYADQGLTQFGWNSQARFDQLQNGGGLNLLEMYQMEVKAYDFIAKRFPQIHNLEADSDMTDDVSTMEITDYSDGQANSEVVEIPMSTGAEPGYGYEDQLAQQRVYDLAFNAELSYYPKGETYAGFCDDEYSWSQIDYYAGVKGENTFCAERGIDYMVYAPLTTGEYYCIDSYGLHGVISSQPKEYTCL